MRWEITCATDWDKAKEIADEGWEPYAVSEFYQPSDYDSGVTTTFYFRRQIHGEESNAGK